MTHEGSMVSEIECRFQSSCRSIIGYIHVAARPEGESSRRNMAKLQLHKSSAD